SLLFVLERTHAGRERLLQNDNVLFTQILAADVDHGCLRVILSGLPSKLLFEHIGESLLNGFCLFVAHDDLCPDSTNQACRNYSSLLFTEAIDFGAAIPACLL